MVLRGRGRPLLRPVPRGPAWSRPRGPRIPRRGLTSGGLVGPFGGGIPAAGRGRLAPRAGLRSAGRADDGLEGARELVVDVPERVNHPARSGCWFGPAGCAAGACRGYLGIARIAVTALAMVLADMQVQERPAAEAHTAERTGRVHVVLLNDLSQAGPGENGMRSL